MASIPPGEAFLLRSAEAIWTAALKAVAPSALICRHISRRGATLYVGDSSFSLAAPRRVFLAALGKAARPMADRLASILGGKLSRGIVLCPPGRPLHRPNIVSLPVPHPLPDRRSLAAARKILALAEQAGEGDLFIVLLSGGASAQACLPPPGLKLADKRRVTERLIRAGADIAELNAVRKHLSLFKGGRLAQAAHPAEILNLVISDVRGNDLETVGSGPAFWDSTTYAGARRVLEKYRMWSSMPASVKKAIEDGRKKMTPEMLKKNSPVFRRMTSLVLGDIGTALEAAAARARRLGFETRVLTGMDHGRARDAAKRYAAVLRAEMSRPGKPGRRFCLLAGGELTVEVRGRGKGGRNTEFVLALLREMGPPAGLPPTGSRQGPSRWFAASLGTDGIDGPTDAAGAWASAGTGERASRLGFEPRRFLDRNDSYSFFKKAGALIRTGPTGTNVMDLRIFMGVASTLSSGKCRRDPVFSL